jgi:hypothetical protein
MAEKFKKNEGNKIRERGEEYVEGVLRNRSTLHHAQNNPKEKHTQKP